MRSALAVCVVMASLALGCASTAPASVLDQAERYDEIIALPEPDLDGSATLEQTLVRRRSQREFAPDELPLDTIGQLLWAAQGITDDEGHRTAPSAGATHSPMIKRKCSKLLGNQDNRKSLAFIRTKSP